MRNGDNERGEETHELGEGLLSEPGSSGSTRAEDLARINEQLLREREELRAQILDLRLLGEEAERANRGLSRLVRITEDNPDPALRVSTKGEILYGNAASVALCRRWNPGQELVIPPAVQEMVDTAYARMRVIRREMTFAAHTYLVTVAATPTGAHYVHIFAEDITARKQAEQQVRENAERLALALSGTQTGMYRRELATGETLCTEPATRLLGLRTTTTTTTTTSQSYHYHDWVERVHREDLPRVEAELLHGRARVV